MSPATLVPGIARLLDRALLAAVLCFLLWIVLGGGKTTADDTGAADPKAAARAIGQAGTAAASAIARDASNAAGVPGYRVANVAAAYRGAVVDQEMDTLAEAVALDVLHVWLSDLHRTVEERAGALDIADGEQLARWREGLRSNRAALARHRSQGLRRFNTALGVIEKLRLIETELAGALSADLRAALAFSRGGAGAGSR